MQDMALHSRTAFLLKGRNPVVHQKEALVIVEAHDADLPLLRVYANTQLLHHVWL